MGLDEDIISTCTAFCSPYAKNHYIVASRDCSGIGCCQAPIPAGLDVYLIQFRRFNGSYSSDQATVYVVDADRLGSYAMDSMSACSQQCWSGSSATRRARATRRRQSTAAATASARTALILMAVTGATARRGTTATPTSWMDAMVRVMVPYGGNSLIA